MEAVPKLLRDLRVAQDTIDALEYTLQDERDAANYWDGMRVEMRVWLGAMVVALASIVALVW